LAPLHSVELATAGRRVKRNDGMNSPAGYPRLIPDSFSVNHKKSFQHALVRGIVALAVAGLPAALFLTGCGASLTPAPEARTIPGKQLAAFVEVAGVRMVIVPDQWSGSPADLRDVTTPLRVTIENRSNQPLAHPIS
jgi:hypothetical protein